jgi:hypothetical protein
LEDRGAKTESASWSCRKFAALGLKWLVHAFETIAAKWEKLSDAFAAKFKVIFAKFGERIEAIIAKLMGKADDVPGGHGQAPDGPDVGGHHGHGPNQAKDLEESGSSDGKNENPSESKKHKEKKAAELPFAVSLARTLLSADDKAGLDAHVAVKLVYMELKVKFDWLKAVRLKPEFTGPYDVYLIGSETLAYRNYHGIETQGDLSRYPLGPNDLDWRGTGKTWRDALEHAAKQTGHPLDEFVPTKWGISKEGKSFPVEWKHESGAEISMDYFHENNGPDAPHVGWQKPGKRSQSGSGLRGHIILDYVIAGRIDKKIDI